MYFKNGSFYFESKSHYTIIIDSYVRNYKYYHKEVSVDSIRRFFQYVSNDISEKRAVLFLNKTHITYIYHSNRRIQALLYDNNEKFQKLLLSTDYETFILGIELLKKEKSTKHDYKFKGHI